MQTKKIFITGTDTDVGKTFFTAALITALKTNGHSVMAIKPVAAGCELIDGQLRNQDALTLIAALQSTTNGHQAVIHSQLEYRRINPVALQPPIAPHIAAAMAEQKLSVKLLQDACQLADYQQDFVLVEGAGGWLVPLNEDETLADFVVAESMQVIMVVGLKLGCINHALLTQQSIRASGLSLIGWVANHVDPQMLQQQQNIESLQSRLNCPMIAEIPYIAETNPAAKASKCVRIDQLLSSTSQN